ncbi:MAG: nuclear transport factor 2 family protein [Gemmatimonadaceae bacterium]|nr:nuclear transport factor 2 family protein [Gemmatimonadaceae bacterium]
MSQSTPERAKALVEYVTAGRILDAMQEFYAPDVVMQDNNNPPCVGKDANIEREKGFLAYVKEIHQNVATTVVASGDEAAIHYILDFTAVDGKRMRLDQVALQTWKDGYIVRERFLYDSASAVQV